MQKSLNYILNRKKINVMSINDLKDYDDIEKVCNSLMKNRIFISKRYPIVEASFDSIWELDPLNDRSWMFWLHTLVIVDNLVNGYEYTGNDKYLDKAISITLNWKKHNFPNSKSVMGWHDHSTALRLIVLCKLFEICRENYKLTESLYNDFVELVKVHCEKLCNDDFYMEKHNHGLDQDISLYIASLVFPEMSQSNQWRKVAITRFWKQVDHLLSPDGSYKEHSPHYSFLVTKRLVSFMDILEKNDFESYMKLKQIVEKSIQYLTHILQPDGLIPPIGDSDSISIDFGSQKKMEVGEVYQHLQYVASKGKQGIIPNTLDKVFPKGGFATFRNKWELDDETVQVIFYSGFHSRVHKHHDDLAFTIYAKGLPIFIDAGKYNYDYNSLERKFVVSGYGHNSIVINGENSDIKRLNIGKTGIVSYSLSQDISVVYGKHCLYSDVIHNRILVYIKPYNVLIIDWLEAHKENTYEQIFNFNHNIKCQAADLQSGSFIGSIENKKLFIIQPLMNTDLEYNLKRGEHQPLRGWSSPHYGNLIPSDQIVYKQKGVQVQFATSINLSPNKTGVRNFQWEDDIIEFEIDVNNKKCSKVQLIIGKENIYTLFNGQLMDCEKVKNEILIEATKEWKVLEYKNKYRQERRRRLRIQEELNKLKN